MIEEVRNVMDSSNTDTLNSNETTSLTNTTSTTPTTTTTTTTTTSTNVVRVGIGCIVMNEKYEIYVGIRKNSHGHNTLALPGGHIEVYEEWNTCAQREVYEEMNLLLDIDTIQFVSVYNNIMMNDYKHYITIIMLCTNPITVVPTNMEPNKCEGWIPYSWNTLINLSIVHPEKFFTPLLQLLQTKPIPTIVVQCLRLNSSNTTTTNVSNSKEEEKREKQQTEQEEQQTEQD